jgi:hypothetical protein
MQSRSRQSTTPGRKAASRGPATVRTSRSTPVISRARPSRRASPTTSGRAQVYTSGSARALTMISGPTPAASPMVMATIGRRIGASWLGAGEAARSACTQRSRVPGSPKAPALVSRIRSRPGTLAWTTPGSASPRTSSWVTSAAVRMDLAVSPPVATSIPRSSRTARAAWARAEAIVMASSRRTGSRGSGARTTSPAPSPSRMAAAVAGRSAGSRKTSPNPARTSSSRWALACSA